MSNLGGEAGEPGSGGGGGGGGGGPEGLAGSPGQNALVGVAERAAKRAQLDLDVRGILALIVLAGALILSSVSLFSLNTLELPSWLTGIVGSVVGFYFGSKGGGSDSGGSGSTNGKSPIVIDRRHQGGPHE